MQNNNYNVDILINDKPIRKYPHNNRIFIEARDGVEYSIRIQNNTWKRILVCSSVDGLNIISGKTATENGPGYVINGYSSTRFEGFRVSNEQIAKFVFGKKKNSYAASKEDGSEKNVGVIGFRVYEELVKPEPFYNSGFYKINTLCDEPLYGSPIWGVSNTGTSCCAGTTTDSVSAPQEKTRCMSKGLSFSGTGQISAKSVSPETFDMGTEWGKSKESKTTEVEFERGYLAVSLDVYYASRQNLIDIGVPLGNEKQVNFPSSFADSKYAKPPRGWNG